LLQEPLCRYHAEVRLSELREKANELESEVKQLKDEYERLCEKYDVQGYGEIEHQLNVEGREDIDESDVQTVNAVESEYAAKRDELNGVEHNITNLERSM
jgi:sugar-specific transcriptional regulator TrmB